jgi:hypothetical protein
MTTVITDYTTYDLAHYYADLKHLPYISREERQHLLTDLSQAHATRATLPDPHHKQQLIESYLPLAKHLAITLCPPTLYRRLLPELIGAVNLAVVEVVMRADLNTTLSLEAYVAAYVRSAIKRTLSTDEIAAHTGIERGVVRSIERDVLARLRAFVAGKATLGQKNGKPCICYPEAHNTSANTPEQETALQAAYDDLQARDSIVTGRPPRPGRANASRSWNGSAPGWKLKGYTSPVQCWQKKQGWRRRPPLTFLKHEGA